MDVNRIGREKIKTAILVLLLAASFVQIGILWGDQSHSFPFNFLLGIFKSSSAEILASDNAAREELFVPFRVIATDGTEEHWYINRQDQYYSKLWNNTKQVLKSIAGKAPVSINQDPVDWGTIVSQKGFVFEFKANFTGKLLSWSLGISGEMPAARKIMIMPDVDDKTKLEVYICSMQADDSYKTLKYLADRDLWSLSPEDDDKLYTELSENKKYVNSNFSLFKEVNFDKRAGLPDVPIVFNPPKFRQYYGIQAETPANVKNIGGKNADEDLANVILGNKIDSYNRESFLDSAQFKNLDSIYTIYRSGLLDYKYIRAQDGAKNADITASLMNAYRFMSNIRRITNTKGELYLSSVDENKTGGYVFKFDYLINGNPVYYNMDIDGGLTHIDSAVKIVADSENVLRCTWMLQDFRITGNSNEYNVYFLDIAEAEVLKNTFINDINVGYVVKSESSLEIEPAMIVEKFEKSGSGIFDIKMPKKGD